MMEPSESRSNTPPAKPKPAGDFFAAVPGARAAPFQKPFRSGWPSASRGVVLPSTEHPIQPALPLDASVFGVFPQPVSHTVPTAIANTNRALRPSMRFAMSLGSISVNEDVPIRILDHLHPPQ